MHRLAGVLLHVQALDSDVARGPVGHVERDRAVADDGVIELGNLIALGKVGIEVVLAVEDASQVDLGLDAKAGADRLLDTAFIDYRQHAGQGGIDQRHLGVGLSPKIGGGA